MNQTVDENETVLRKKDTVKLKKGAIKKINVSDDIHMISNKNI